MKSQKFNKSKSAVSIDVGTILIAQPFWEEQIYKRSVIMLLNHDSEGNSGIILNKPSSLFVNEALPGLQITPSLFYGGPINNHSICYIHNDANVPEAVSLGNELFCGGNFEYLEKMIVNNEMDSEKIRFYAGIVSWYGGQLEAELEENKWWPGEIIGDELFTTSPEALWSHELLETGNMYGLFGEAPDPSLN